MRVNRKMLPMKAHYFLWNAGTAPVVPFLSIYARQLGFSGTVVGIIYTILPICGMIAKPAAGVIADRFRCQRWIFLAFQLLTAAAFLAINFVPALPMHQEVRFACDNGAAALDTCHTNNRNATRADLVCDETFEPKEVRCLLDCPMSTANWATIAKYWNLSAAARDSPHANHLSFTAHVAYDKTIVLNPQCYLYHVEQLSFADGAVRRAYCRAGDESIVEMCAVTCDDRRIDAKVQQPNIADDAVTSYYQFWLLLAFMIFGWVSQAVVVSVGDAICFEMLEDRPDKYGVQRSFGALGWGLFSVIAGFLVDNYSDSGSQKDYSVSFYLAVAVLVLDFVASLRIQHVQHNLSASILRDVSQLLVDLRILVFVLWCIAVGLCTGLIWNFLFWLVEDLAQKHSCETVAWIKTLEGVIMAVQCLFGELPCFFLSGAILKRIGHVHAMSLILLATGIRCILYSIITNPWWFLPVELLQGITFGLFYACMASYASIVARPGTETTVQGLVGALFEGVGVSLGSYVAGVLFDAYGGEMTFRVFGIGALIACLLHEVAQWLVHRRLRNKDVLMYSTPEDALTMMDTSDSDRRPNHMGS